MALSGVRVLDLTRLLPGPFATQILADLGAEVIKIEEPMSGDYSRWNPPLCKDGNSAVFHALNRGKKSVTLNLKHKKDQSLFLKLVHTADVLVESFRPGVLAKLGLTQQVLSEEYPSLIVCSISGYGQSGPLSQRAGHDINYLARSGLLRLSKDPITLPVAQIADLAGGAWPAAFQIVCALYYRQSESKHGSNAGGNYIDVSMTHGSYALGIMPQSSNNFLCAKQQSQSVSTISEGKFILNGVPCYNVYPCKDGWISVGSLEPKFWKKVCIATGLTHLKNQGLVSGKAAEKVISEVSDKFREKSMDEWERIFESVDACVEIIRQSERIGELDPQLMHRKVDINITVGSDTFAVPKTPLNMKHGLQFQSQSGPKLGEHNPEILSKL